MTEIDVHYWIQGVELPQIRGMLTLYLLDLMDGEYQQREWVEKDSDTSFHQSILFPWELFDDLNLYNYLKVGKIPYNHVGLSLKTKLEAEKLYNLVDLSEQLSKDACAGNNDVCYSPPNSAYLSSPYLEPMRQAAGEAFKVFMANEKDNHEFCEFIAQIEAERKAIAKHSSP